MNVNTGIPYETLAQSIFQEIQDQNDAQTIEVARNVRLQGNLLPHQIDVYWKFKVGDIVYQTIVEVRDYDSKIKQAAILAFDRVLNDVPGQPRGVMVTRTGFQSGAEAFAKQRGIKLYRLRQWQHRTMISDVSYATYAIDQHLVMYITAYRPEVHLHFHVVSSSSSSKKIPKDHPRHFSEMRLFDADGKRVGTVADIIRGFVASMRDAKTLSATYKHDFLVPTYRQFSPPSARRTRLSAVEAAITLVPEPQPPHAMLPSGVIQFILEDLDDGTSQVFRRGSIPRLKEREE